MKICFWGTRGSLPLALKHDDVLKLFSELTREAEGQNLSSLAEFKSFLSKYKTPLSYGGNSSCIEVRAPNSPVIFTDMGSGMREAGHYYVTKGIHEFHVFLTHMHWDHLIGLPFFTPIYTQGNKIYIYHVHKNAPDYVRIKFNGVNFPVAWDQLQGDIEFVQVKLYDEVEVGEVKIMPFSLDHPGGSFGYRYNHGKYSAAVGVDGEFKRVTRKDLGKDLKAYQDLDLLIFDAQYELSELASRFDWGHSSPNIGVDLALREVITNLVFTHHDPWSDRHKLARMLQQAADHRDVGLVDHKEAWEKFGVPQGPNLIMAYDGLTLDLTQLKREAP